MLSKTKKCPVCGGTDDGYTYEPDEEQEAMGYPAEFHLCATCWAPLLTSTANPSQESNDA